MREWPRRAFGTTLACLLVASCHSDSDRAPFAGGIEPSPTNDGGIVIPPGNTHDSGPPNCGGQTLEAVIDKPLLYFVIDRSGSMSALMPDSRLTRYEAAVEAVGEVLASVGHRVRYGVTVYPSGSSAGNCGAGQQVFAATDGDPLSESNEAGEGPVLELLLKRLKTQSLGGATPTAATLESVGRRVEGLAKSVSVVLVTDGAPNCNARASCTSELCIPDLEGVELAEGVCGEDFSCCDEELFGAGAGSNCVDETASVEAVSGLADAGIRTFVVGLPGTQTFASVLDRLAEAGGAPRSGSTAYFATDDSASLAAALHEIGAGVTIPCEVELTKVPDDLTRLNLYFDQDVVPQDPNNGWTWSGNSALTLVGEACDSLKSGAVSELQIVYGCETILR